MPQQSFQFDPDRQDEMPLSEREDPDAVHAFDSSSDFSGQKLSLRETTMRPTAIQRLVLAVVSLLILFLYALVLSLLLLTGIIGPTVAQSFAPAFGYFGLGLCIAVIVVNTLFNRKQ